MKDNIAHTPQIEQNKIESSEETLHLKDKENQNCINELHNTETRVAELEKRLGILRKLVKDQEATIELNNQTTQRRESKNTTKESNELHTHFANINDTLKGCGRKIKCNKYYRLQRSRIGGKLDGRKKVRRQSILC